MATPGASIQSGQYTQSDLDRYDHALQAMQQAIAEARESQDTGLFSNHNIASFLGALQSVKGTADITVAGLADATGPIGKEIGVLYKFVEGSVDVVNANSIGNTSKVASGLVSTVGSMMPNEAVRDASEFAAGIGSGANALQNGDATEALKGGLDVLNASGLHTAGSLSTIVGGAKDISEGINKFNDSQELGAQLKAGSDSQISRMMAQFQHIQEQRDQIYQHLHPDQSDTGWKPDLPISLNPTDSQANAEGSMTDFTGHSAAEAASEAGQHDQTALQAEQEAQQHAQTAGQHETEAQTHAQAAGQHETEAQTHAQTAGQHETEAQTHAQAAGQHETEAQTHAQAAGQHETEAQTHAQAAGQHETEAQTHAQAAGQHETEAQTHAQAAAQHETESRPTPKPRDSTRPRLRPTLKLQRSTRPRLRPTPKPRGSTRPRHKPTLKLQRSTRPKHRPTPKPRGSTRPRHKPTLKPQRSTRPKRRPTLKSPRNMRPKRRPTLKLPDSTRPKRRPTLNRSAARTGSTTARPGRRSA